MTLTAEPHKESPYLNHDSSMIRKPVTGPVILAAARPHAYWYWIDGNVTRVPHRQQTPNERTLHVQFLKTFRQG